MASYYDLVLGIIPLSLLGVSGLLSVVGFSLTTAIPLAALVTVGIIGHAMFVNGPVDAVPERESPTSPGGHGDDRAGSAETARKPEGELAILGAW